MLSAIAQSSVGNAQSGSMDAWSVGGGWRVQRGDAGCGASRAGDPFFTMSQRLDGNVDIGVRAPGGNFSAENPAYIQFWATDASGRPILTKTYTGVVDSRSSGTLLYLHTEGSFAGDNAQATSAVVSPGPGSNPRPVALPDLPYVLRIVRRCLTELGRVDRGSGQPATTAPILRDPRSPLVVPDDYPSAALREEGEGVTFVTLTVSARGLISNCRIKSSSGRADLDQQTCLSLSRRARYVPAKDAQGNPTEGESIQPIRWQIPRH